MTKRIKDYFLMNEFSRKEQPVHNCEKEQEELEQFETADLAGIEASETFKKNLKDKLWDLLKDKYYIFFALAVFLFG